MITEDTQDPTQETEEAAPETAPEAEAPVAEQPSAEGAAEAAEAAEEAAPEPESGKPEGHKRAGGWQRRIGRLEREREMLLEQLAAQRAGQPTPAQPAKAKTPEEQAAEYVESLVEKRLTERETQRQQQAITAAFQARTQEVRAAHPDFDEVISSVEVPVSAALSEALLTSDHGPRIMYQLAADPAELARLSALPPLAAAREVGRLEAKLASVTAAPAKPNPAVAPRKPAAPAPITPVTTRGPSAVKDPSEMTYEQYTAWRESQRKR